MSWLDEVLTQHQELESPRNFWYWSALCAISAIVKDNVWIDRQAFRLYPNIYVMLHADSGLKKGAPVSLAKKLVQRVNNTRIISGRSSIQGILKELGTFTSTPGGGIRTNASTGFIVASEFSSSLINDPAALTILTDLYDRNLNEGDWRSLLKMETFELKNPTISLLVATNEAHFDDFVESKDIHGGFIGRTFIIAEHKVHRLNPLIKKMKVVPDVDELAEYLKTIAPLRGPFEDLDNTPAGDLYDQWYMKFYTQVVEQEVKDDTGTIQRFGDSVLKVAMLLSLSDSANRIITIDNMEEAISVCEKLIGNVRKTTHGKRGMSATAQHKALIIKELISRDNHQISREMLMKKYYMHFNSSELDDVIQAFQQANMIICENIGNKIVYTMPDEQVKEMKRFLEGKNK